MPKISVVIPVYNVESYLSQCLDSVLNQTFTDFECICVNDGSTDNSLAILQEYISKDSRIKIINQENKGLSGARNAALKVMDGQYITFIDSDDFVSNDYLERLLVLAEKDNSDIVYCRHKMYYSLDNRYENGPNREKLINLFFEYSQSQQKNKQLKYILDIVENSRSACMKLYKTEILIKNKISFFENVYAEEDFAFNVLINLCSQNISFFDEELYFYRKQVESLTADGEKLRINALNSFMILTKALYNRNLLKDSEILQNFIIKGFIYRLGKTISKEKYKLLLPEIKNNLFFLKNICKNCSFVFKIKLKVSIFFVKLFNDNSAVLFKILKNF